MGTRAALLALAAALALAGCGDAEKRTERVTLALDFVPNGAHAGVFGAKAGGADRRHGVALRVRTPTASTDSLKLLLSGRADLAVVDIHDLGLAREKGTDIVGVGALVQRPLAAVIARGSPATPRALEGERVGVTGVPSDDAVLKAVMEGGGGDPAAVRKITIGFGAVPSLVTGKVAAATAFWNVEGVTLKRRGVRTREFRVNDYGAPTYPELVVVARRSVLDKRRGAIEDTLAALAEGTKFALANPGKVTGPIAKAGGSDRPLVAAELDAIRPALSPPLKLDPVVLKQWADFDVRFGILSRPADVERAFDFSAGP